MCREPSGRLTASHPQPPGRPGAAVPTHAAGRWGSCWPGSAACQRRSCTGTGGGKAGSACPAGPTGTPRTRCCCRCSPHLRAAGTSRIQGSVASGELGTGGQLRCRKGVSLSLATHWQYPTSPGGCCGKEKPERAEEGHQGAGLLMRCGPESRLLGQAQMQPAPTPQQKKRLCGPTLTPQIKELRCLSIPQNQIQNVEEMPPYGTCLPFG